VAYASSFFLPTFAIVVDGKRSVSCGYDAFLIGTLSPLASPFFGGYRVFVPWLANPMLWVGVALFTIGRPRGAFNAGIIAIGLSGTLLLPVEAEGFRLILVGYYVWVVSMAMLALAAGIRATVGNR
jgi:hypothetical protein